MADITISDLELAPALADDMVLAVENTTDTYAATLAMLRRLINKTFVEVENANFNDLMDDGFYQCTGTPTNSPVAGAINWTLQVSAESGVVVQRAFSLDDNFANLYIRRWNGVTWTGWLEVGAGALANKANISLSNLNETGQAVINGKANTDANNFTAAGKQNIVGWGMPNYSAGIAKPINTTQTATMNCLVVARSANSTNPLNLYVGGVIVGTGGNYYATSRTFGYALVAKGQSYRTENVATYGSWDASVIEYPLLGG